jgi:hypothetical protein
MQLIEHHRNITILNLLFFGEIGSNRSLYRRSSHIPVLHV